MGRKTITCGLNGQLGEILSKCGDVNSKECKEILKQLEDIKKRDTFITNIFEKDVTIFDTFITVKDISYEDLVSLANKDIFLPMVKRDNSFYARDFKPTNYSKQYTPINISNFKVGFDEYFGLTLYTYIIYNDEFIDVQLSIKDNKNMFYISGEQNNYQGGYRIENCELHLRDLIFNDYKKIKYWASETAYNSFVMYSEKESLKDWLIYNKDFLSKGV